MARSSSRPTFPTMVSDAIDSAPPITKIVDSVLRTTGPGSLAYTTASGGPPTEETVSEKPDATPAITRARGVGLRPRSRRFSAAAASTATPTAIEIPRAEIDATNSAPATVPGTRPVSAQRTPRLSAAARSRWATRRVSDIPAISNGAGMRSGSMSASSGAASRFIPNPTPPWIIAPTSITSAATTRSVGLTARSGYGVASAPERTFSINRAADVHHVEVARDDEAADLCWESQPREIIDASLFQYKDYFQMKFCLGWEFDETYCWCPLERIPTDYQPF